MDEPTIKLPQAASSFEAAIPSSPRLPVATVTGSTAAMSPKLDAAAAPLTPEALIFHILETGRVGGRPVSRLGDSERVILERAPSGNAWTATVPGQNPLVGLWWRGTELIRDSKPRTQLAVSLISSALRLLALYFLWPALSRRRQLRPGEISSTAVRRDGLQTAPTYGESSCSGDPLGRPESRRRVP